MAERQAPAPTAPSRAARIRDVTSDPVAMGKVRGPCAGFLRHIGRTKGEGLWNGVTPPINFRIELEDET